MTDKKIYSIDELIEMGMAREEAVVYQRSLFEVEPVFDLEKLTEVQKVIKSKAYSTNDKIITQTGVSNGPNWRDLEFSHPKRCVRLGTVFSGIGAIEHAFQRLGLNHKIDFAGDID